MDLYEQITKVDFKAALKEKNPHTKEVLKMVNSELKGEIKNTEIRLGKDRLVDEEIISIVKKSKKICLEQIGYAKDADLHCKVLTFEDCLEKFESYLPEEASIEQLKMTVELAISNLNDAGSPINMGTVMKSCKKVLAINKTPHDGKLLSSIVKDLV